MEEENAKEVKDEAAEFSAFDATKKKKKKKVIHDLGEVKVLSKEVENISVSDGVNNNLSGSKKNKTIKLMGFDDHDEGVDNVDQLDEEDEEAEGVVSRSQHPWENSDHDYHCEEVIFPTLDARVKNVAQTYSLEHMGEMQLFELLFALLDSGMHHLENFPKELASCAGALQTSINQHIYKEEEQVFPLLIENFSYEEQASLVWQLFCSIPVNMMAEFLPCISSSLIPSEYHQMLQCLCKIVPEDKLLQQIVYNWMEGKKNSSNLQSSEGNSILQRSEHKCLNTSTQKVDNKKCFCNSFKMGKRRYAEFSHICDIPGIHPIDDILYWHKAIWKELNEIVAQAKEINHSQDFTNLFSFIERLEFITEVCIFHSIAEDKVIFPAVDGGICFLEEHAEEKTRFNEFRFLIERIQSVGAASTSAVEFNEKLCSHADQIVETLQKHFENEEIQVLPLARKLFSHKKQRELLYQSLCTMPLRSIERVLPWIIESMDEDQAKSFLYNLLTEAPGSDNALAALFNGWACKGQSGVTCLSSCSLGYCCVSRLFECEDSFSNSGCEHDSVLCICGNCPLCDNKYGSREEKIDSESLKSVIISEISDNKKVVKSSTRDGICCVPGLGVDSNNLGLSCTGKYLRSLSFSMSAPPINSSLFAWESENNSSEVSLETSPIDTIFKFHKAIRKDLEYLDIESGKLDDYKETSLHQFIGRFRLLWGFYRAHSNAEDDIVFPALESKESLINVSRSYMLDHKQEEQLFEDISWVLDDLSHLHDALKRSFCASKCCKDDAVCPDGAPDCVRKYKELCTKLQGMCKSIRVALDQHVFREEHELWPLFGRYFSVEEQDKIIGRIIGTMGAEVLQSMLPWVTSALTHDEQNKLMDAWKHATKNTMFNEWLNECWKGSSICTETSQSGLHETDISLHESSKHNNRMFKPGWKDIFRMNQNELESEIRKVYRDSTLDPRRKAYLVQNLITSRWIAAQQKLPQESEDASNPDILAECSPSFRDTDKRMFGCEHYKRNCKVRASCCGKLFTCRFCHDNVSDHSMDRKSTSEMMCMRCLQMQPVGPVCSTPSCNGFSMAKYYCNICKFFDDERTVYHCPFCNLCRVGSGLGIDYFHCMTCNSCLGMKLVDHKCLEKGLESNCPICCDFLFTSSASVRSLPCGHFMHSACFQAYTCAHYTCPICRKSLGDMEVYFGMLDALLAAEQLPEEYADRFQTILCNDCDNRGRSRFHWLYHKCSHCGSYNTRLLD